ncbi:MAG: FAD-dependent oxidoreductase [Pseudomonadota bacterium]
MIDFLVIGGGIAGISAGARVAQMGKTLVLEAENHLAYHSSGRSAALYEETYGKPTTIALNRASKDYHFTAHGGVLSPRGLLLIGQKHEADAFDQDCTMMSLDRLTLDQAQSLLPILNTGTVTFAAHHAEAWDIDTDKLIQDFARDIRSAGGSVTTGERVTGITRTKRGWDVTTSKTTHQTKTLINAAGSWADQIARLAGIRPLGLTPLKRSMARIAAPGGYETKSWPMIFGPGESWYAKPDAGALLVSPADETPVDPHDAWADDMDLAMGLAAYQDYVTQEVTKPISSWAGLRTFSPDRSLVLGRAVDDDSFVWCAGQGGYGMQTSPAASALIGDICAERPPVLDPETVQALSPQRFA